MKNLVFTTTGLVFFLSLFFLNPCFSQEEIPSDSVGLQEEGAEQKIAIDEIFRRVTISGFLNTRYFRDPGTSAVVFREGFNAKRGLFISHVGPLELYDALVQIDAIPSVFPSPPENGQASLMDDETGDTSNVFKEQGVPNGTRLKVFFTWKEAGIEYPLGEIISPRPRQHYEIRFSGNRDHAESVGSGDLLCLDNCEIGIVGNIAIERKRRSSSPVAFFINKRVLPPNGHEVKIIFQVDGKEEDNGINNENPFNSDSY